MGIDDVLSNLSKYKEEEPFSDVPEYAKVVEKAIKHYSDIAVFNLYEDTDEFDIMYYLARLGYYVQAEKAYKYLNIVKVIKINYGSLTFYLVKVGKRGIIVQADKVEWAVSEAIGSLLVAIRDKYGDGKRVDSPAGILNIYEKEDAALKTVPEIVQEAVKGPWYEDEIDVEVEIGDKHGFKVKVWEKETEAAVIVFVGIEAIEEYIVEVLRKFF